VNTIRSYCNQRQIYCGGCLFIGAGWRNAWIGSLILASICGFAYGWHERFVNPPLLVVMREKQPPEDTLLKRGRYDQAAKLVLASIKGDKTDYFKYQTLATIYYARALKDQANREQWIQQAASYEAKSVSVAQNDPISALPAAFGLDTIADASSKPCPYYQTATQYAQEAIEELKGDAIFVGDEKMPTKPIRDDLEKLQDKIQGKINAKCEHTR